MSAVEIYLVRHCETIANAGLWTAFDKEVVLTPYGEKQAITLAEKINQRPHEIILSPLKRAQDSAIPLLAKWPEVPVETWPVIEEFHYLSNTKYQTAEQRKKAIKDYWQACDPNYCDGPHAESFAALMQRVKDFHQALSHLTGINIIISHGQLIKAYLLGLKENFPSTKEFMAHFRAMETSDPIKNAEMIRIK